MQKSSRSSGSGCIMSLLFVLWLLMVCLAPESQGQRLRETETDQPAARVQLAERDALCHPDGCYAVFLQKRTFREAGRSCRERGGTLATMHTDEAAGVVHELLSSIEAQGARPRLRLWIGLHRPPRQCSNNRPLRGFVWVTGLNFSDILPSICLIGTFITISIIFRRFKSKKCKSYSIFHKSS